MIEGQQSTRYDCKNPPFGGNVGQSVERKE